MRTHSWSKHPPYLFTVAGWAVGDGVDMARLPKISDHMARMQDRPAVGKVVALHAG